MTRLPNLRKIPDPRKLPIHQTRVDVIIPHEEKFKMPIYETRLDTPVAHDVIKTYGGRTPICPESELRASILRSLGITSKNKN